VRDQGCTKLAQVAVKAGGAVGGPELVGFVLLDPLCEAGEETGYVVSIQRMKRSAHAGGVRLGRRGAWECLHDVKGLTVVLVCHTRLATPLAGWLSSAATCAQGSISP
jgi:hypothetical protein